MSDLIHGKMVSIMRKVGAIDKGRDNKSQNYKFRGIDDVYNALHTIMAEEGVYCRPNVISREQVERQSKQGGMLFYTTVTVEYAFIAEDGSSVNMTITGEGMDSADKSNLKALSNAHKGVLLQAFLIPTNDKKDTEDDDYEIESKPESKPAEKPSEKKSENPDSVTPDALVDRLNDADNIPLLDNIFNKYIKGNPSKWDNDTFQKVWASYRDNKNRIADALRGEG